MITTMRTAPEGRLTLLADGKTSEPRVSANGHVVVWSQRLDDGCWGVMKHEDGVTTRISEDGFTCTNVALSDDGKTIAYAARPFSGPKSDFDVLMWRDGHTRPIANGPGNEYSVAVSGDGSTIAWDDDIDGSWFNTWRIGKWQNGETKLLTDGSILSEFPFIADTNQVFFRQQKYENSFIAGERPGDGLIQAMAMGPGDCVRGDVTDDGKVFTWTDNAGEFNSIMRSENGETTTLISEPGVDHTWSRMSGDESHMVWTSFDRRGTDPSKPKVGVMYRENGENQMIALGDDEGMPVMPDVSDDGNAVTWLWVGHGSDTPTRVYLWERDTPGAKVADLSTRPA